MRGYYSEALSSLTTRTKRRRLRRCTEVSAGSETIGLDTIEVEEAPQKEGVGGREGGRGG